jgi:gamma-glutamyltranspeptidase/glutathione hydrolase
MVKAAASYSSLDFAGKDHGDTIYLTAADGHGNVISFIQSLFSSFGAGFVAGQTGITLHNRGSGFVLTPGHPNELGPHKRPLHTLVPAMLLRDGKPWVSFGVMGGDNQAQAHAQMVANFVDFGMHVQQAGDAPRMRHMGDELALENGIGSDVRLALEDGRGLVGGYQAIHIDPNTGVLMGGSDARKDGLAIGW